MSRVGENDRDITQRAGGGETDKIHNVLEIVGTADL